MRTTTRDEPTPLRDQINCELARGKSELAQGHKCSKCF